MRRTLGTLGVWLCVATGVAQAQSPSAVQSVQATSSVRDQLMPAATVALLAPKPILHEEKEAVTSTTIAVRRGEGTAYMIAGLALFLAGVIVDDDDAGTVLILAGAGIGAYGLYLHFR